MSSCFCLAKWNTVTLHLESGTTHSCHHPRVHQIPAGELVGNPSALHNTQFKIFQREQMMKGIRP
ncbi:MAG: twitch domain-containing radical SAM protein, partial [Pseudobdellovibrio sp.]